MKTVTLKSEQHPFKAGTILRAYVEGLPLYLSGETEEEVKHKLALAYAGQEYVVIVE